MMARKRDSFLITNGRALKRRGLSGYDVRVRLDGQTLTFRDERGRTVAVPAASVDRLRHFRMGGVQSVGGGEGTSTIYETKIWWEGGWTPILLVPFRGNDVYRAALSAFARHVVDAHGLDRIRLGPGYVTAIINLLLVGPFTLAFLVYVF